jgi:hypothetical protein
MDGKTLSSLLDIFCRERNMPLSAENQAEGFGGKKVVIDHEDRAHKPLHSVRVASWLNGSTDEE